MIFHRRISIIPQALMSAILLSAILAQLALVVTVTRGLVTERLSAAPVFSRRS